MQITSRLQYLVWLQVLVVCFGSNKCLWVRQREVLAFEKHRLEKVSEATALIDHKKLPNAAAFHRAVKVRLISTPVSAAQTAQSPAVRSPSSLP